VKEVYIGICVATHVDKASRDRVARSNRGEFRCTHFPVHVSEREGGQIHPLLGGLLPLGWGVSKTSKLPQSVGILDWHLGGHQVQVSSIAPVFPKHHL